ncbi:unnamed protein product [Pieris brassicae]|uniref:Uncharacterized protein n=1 Tax=Pieris brassicae TaxID=7116 RepID=A0A9P0T0W6_PIEBR|nr:unnamed protein product [Pieris brassicae]
MLFKQFSQNNVRFTKKIEPVPPENARKRGVNKSNWKCEKKRRERYSAKKLPSFPKCKHKTDSTFKCLTLKTQDVAWFHQIFYKLVRRSYKDGGSVAKENRGGNHKKDKYAQRQRSVMTFIESIEAAEPHYCRATSFVRKYLPPELNIKKLWKMYEEQIAITPYLKVKQSFFRQIFNRKYNVGFGSPLKDTCSRCFELKRKIESTNSQEKQIHITQKRLHSLKAKAFCDLLKKEEHDTISMSFDCQKNSALPKLPDQVAYFSRQFNMSNFTVVIGTSKSALDNVRTYYWCENEHAKSSSEIASAAFDTLISLDIPSDKTRVRLFADGCGGQNKNTILVGIGMKWLYSNAPPHVKKIEIIFPMVGHSFLPPDRVFAKIEKAVKKMSVICDPQIYVNLSTKHATVVKHLGVDVEVYDRKNEVNNVCKPPSAGISNLMLANDLYCTKVARMSAYKERKTTEANILSQNM